MYASKALEACVDGSTHNKSTTLDRNGEGTIRPWYDTRRRNVNQAINQRGKNGTNAQFLRPNDIGTHELRDGVIE